MSTVTTLSLIEERRHDASTWHCQEFNATQLVLQCFVQTDAWQHGKAWELQGAAAARQGCVAFVVQECAAFSSCVNALITLSGAPSVANNNVYYFFQTFQCFLMNSMPTVYHIDFLLEASTIRYGMQYAFFEQNGDRCWVAIGGQPANESLLVCLFFNSSGACHSRFPRVNTIIVKEYT